MNESQDGMIFVHFVSFAVYQRQNLESNNVRGLLGPFPYTRLLFVDPFLPHRLSSP